MRKFLFKKKAHLIWESRNNSKLQKMYVCATLLGPEGIDFFVHQFFHLQNGDNDSTCFRRLLQNKFIFQVFAGKSSMLESFYYYYCYYREVHQ